MAAALLRLHVSPDVIRRRRPSRTADLTSKKGSPAIAPIRVRPSAELEPVRLAAPTAPNPFAPGREIAFARVEGDPLAKAGIRDGDHVALARRDEAEHGDLAAVVGLDGRAALWKAYPEGAWMRLATGDPGVSARLENPRVQGVVVAVLRKFRDDAREED